MTKDQLFRCRSLRPTSSRLRTTLLLVSTALCLSAFAAPAAMADSAGISGTVTDAVTGANLANVQVNVYDATTGDRLAAQCTGSDGTYDISIDPGTYTVGFESTEGDFKVCGGETNFLAQYYSGQATLASAATVTVPTDATATGIDAAMLPGGAIAGTVTDATTGLPAPGVEIDALDAQGNVIGSTCSGSDGTYSIYALAGGSYEVEFLNTATCGGSTTYTAQYYNDQNSLAAAQPVPVNVSATTTGIDAAMAPPATSALSVSLDGSGSGSVQVDPSGTSCSQSCSHAFSPGTAVTLTAAPASGSEFTGWTGACSGTGDCHVTMDSDQSVGATFDVPSTPTPTPSPSPSSSSPSPGFTTTAAPTCSVKTPSTSVNTTTKSKSKSGKVKKVGVMTVNLSCSQPGSKVYVRGKVTYTVPKPGGKTGRSRGTVTRTVSFTVRPVRSSTHSGRLTVTLPRSVVKALKSGAKVTLHLTTTTVNRNGSATTRTRGVTLHKAP